MRVASHPEWIITSEELEPVLGQVTLLDVREPFEREESCITGDDMDVLVPMGELMMRVEQALPDKSQDIVIYCAHGVRSMHALMAMARMGYQKLRSLEGGICAWQERRQA